MATSPHSFFPRDYSANFVMTDEGRDTLHRFVDHNQLRDERRGEIQWTYHNDILECNVRTGETRPLARDATALSRACSRTQDNGVDFGSFTLNDVAIVSSDLSLSAPTVNLTEKKDFDWYGGCHRCYQFSMLFGTAPNSIGQINNEEDFEKYKMQFVEHYNEKHKDLYEWRKKKAGKKPITSQENIDSLKGRMNNQANSMGFFSSAWIPVNGVTIDEAAITAESINGVDIVQTLSTINMTIEETHIITILEESGQILPDDQKRLEEKYGKSPIQDALKKYRRNLMTTPRRGFRDQTRREPFGRSLFHRL